MNILFQSFNVFRVVPAKHHDNHKTTLSYYTVSCVLPVYSRQTGPDHLLPLFFTGTSHRSTMWTFQIFVNPDCVRLFRSRLTHAAPPPCFGHNNAPDNNLPSVKLFSANILYHQIILTLRYFWKLQRVAIRYIIASILYLTHLQYCKRKKDKHQTLTKQFCNIMVKLHINK